MPVDVVMTISPRDTLGREVVREVDENAVKFGALRDSSRLAETVVDRGVWRLGKSRYPMFAGFTDGQASAVQQQSEAALAAASQILDRGEAAALSEQSGRKMSCRAHVDARRILVVENGDGALIL